jgi:hypothetical protein
LVKALVTTFVVVPVSLRSENLRAFDPDPISSIPMKRQTQTAWKQLERRVVEGQNRQIVQRKIKV